MTYTVIADSRERTPWKFPHANRTVTRKLRVGDYTLLGYASDISIERKSFGDFCNCMFGDGWRRFRSQLNRLAHVDYSCIMVEGTTSSLRWYKATRIGADAMMDRIAEITAIWGMPVILCETRKQAQSAAWSFLRHSMDCVTKKYAGK